MLPPDHFLSLRPSFAHGSLAHPDSASAAPSTSTLASADFEVDVRTGFLPAEPGLLAVPARYTQWESLLDRARAGAVRIGGAGEDKAQADAWRNEVREVRARFPSLPSFAGLGSFRRSAFPCSTLEADALCSFVSRPPFRRWPCSGCLRST